MSQPVILVGLIVAAILWLLGKSTGEQRSGDLVSGFASGMLAMLLTIALLAGIFYQISAGGGL